MKVDVFFKFDDRECAKEAGARFDFDRKKWYIDDKYQTKNDFYERFNHVKKNGISDNFEIVMHESKAEIIFQLGGEDSIASRFGVMSEFQSFWIPMKKSEFWPRFKELEKKQQLKELPGKIRKWVKWETGYLELDDEKDELIDADFHFINAYFKNRLIN
jgi:hypothetical protein